MLRDHPLLYHAMTAKQLLPEVYKLAFVVPGKYIERFSPRLESPNHFFCSFYSPTNNNKNTLKYTENVNFFHYYAQFWALNIKIAANIHSKVSLWLKRLAEDTRKVI